MRHLLYTGVAFKTLLLINHLDIYKIQF